MYNLKIKSCGASANLISILHDSLDLLIQKVFVKVIPVASFVDIADYQADTLLNVKALL